MPVVLGVDSSTQSAKVEARALEDGRLLATGAAPHPATTPPVSEQNPDAWWSALVEAVGQVPPEVRSEVVAISVAAQQHGLVLRDVAGVALRPAKLWNDTTSAPQAEALVAKLGPTAWAEACGSVPVASFTITKLAWVAEHEPELMDRVDRVLLPHDDLIWRLSGNHVTDRGDASGTGWFDTTAGRYREDLLATAVTDPMAWLERMPRVLGPTEPAGHLTAEAAAALGLPDGVLVGPGTGDNMGAALGLGLRPGDVVVSLGTSGVAYAVSNRPTADATGAVAGFADATGHHLPLVCTLNATKVTDAVARWLGTDAAGLADLAADAPADAMADPVLVPYFDGERTPNRPDATGHLVGLRTDTTREQIARAAHDGVLCGLLGGVDALAAAGVETGGRLLLIGGGARSAAYRNRLADLAGRTVTVPEVDEAVAAGAAVQAAAILGGAPADIAARWGLGAGSEVQPGPGRSAAEGVRARYRECVATV